MTIYAHTGFSLVVKTYILQERSDICHGTCMPPNVVTTLVLSLQRKAGKQSFTGDDGRYTKFTLMLSTYTCGYSIMQTKVSMQTKLVMMRKVDCL